MEIASRLLVYVDPRFLLNYYTTFYLVKQIQSESSDGFEILVNFIYLLISSSLFMYYIIYQLVPSFQKFLDFFHLLNTGKLWPLSFHVTSSSKRTKLT